MVSDKLVEEVYRKLSRSWWGTILIAIAVIGIVMFAIWNSFPDATKERILSAADNGGATNDKIPASAPRCALRVSSFSFEQNSPYLSGMTEIKMGILVPEAIQILQRCHAAYRIEQDSPVIRRLEVTPMDGLVSGITYYSLRNKINTIGFSISSSTSHEALRIAARQAFGPPDKRWTNADFHYDQWSIGDVKLSVFEQGGSVFIE